jgi:hypothetical protein
MRYFHEFLGFHWITVTNSKLFLLSSKYLLSKSQRKGISRKSWGHALTETLTTQTHLSIHGSTALVDLGRFFNFLVYTDCRTSWTGDQPVARPLPTHRINAHRHLWLQWDSNPRSQCPSRRRRFMP